jgi:diguanylate cyclase (GGDEF)-like protein
VAEPTPPSISPLRGLLAVTRLVRRAEDLPELLTAIARTVAESIGYATVAIDLYRPEWHDFCVSTVHGSDEARAALLGRVRSIGDWEQLLSERFEACRADFVRAGELDRTSAGSGYGHEYAPAVEAEPGEGAGRPVDALFVPMRRHDGSLLGILSLDEPVSLRRPSDEDLDLLVALGDHVALAVESARAAAEAQRHRLALERLLDVSARLTGQADTDDILRAVCSCVADALGFASVLASLVAESGDVLEPRAAVGSRVDRPGGARPVRLAELEPLLDPELEVEGCFLLTSEEVERRVSRDLLPSVSQRNGRGPLAWDRHRLIVPLRDSEGRVIGMIAADGPEDGLLPSAGRLQALRLFANQAAAAVVAAASLRELRFLADHDWLTRLPNRRAFVERLESEVGRAVRYGRPVALVLCDLDGFKGLNDSFGHPAGDDALEAFAGLLRAGLRRSDAAFRIGGDEFALLLVEATEEVASGVVGRVRGMLAASTDERISGMCASFGVAACPADASKAKALFRLADEALYEAKRSGTGVRFVA